MTTSTQWYLDIIERELADLPADERAELLEDLSAHFSEFESGEDLVATLGDGWGRGDPHLRVRNDAQFYDGTLHRPEHSLRAVGL